MLPSIFLVIFIVVFCVQLGYWLLLYGSFAFAKPTHENSKELPVSVLIAARNEAENLKNNLPKLLEQNYPVFEIIVISDASVDLTTDVVRGLQKEYPQLKLIELAKSATYYGNKKKALTRGVREARYEHLLFTDADCQPISSEWIKNMTAPLNEGKALVLGYGAYIKTTGFLNKLIRYETVLTAIQYFSYALRGVPYMGVGRNLAYKKELFDQANGFEHHLNLLSGDDDLFINQIATKENTDICFSRASFTESTPKTSFSSWFRQKLRHISTAHSYRPLHKIMLGTFYLSQFLFWALSILVLSFSLNWQLVILLILIRQFVQFMILTKATTKLNERDLIWWTPILEIVLICTQLALFLYQLIQKPKHW